MDKSILTKNKVIIIFLIVVVLILVNKFTNNKRINLLTKTSSDNDISLSCPDCNLIMISLSNVSAEHMSLYGYERLTTPKLDEWSKDAIVFNNFFTQTSWTLPVATSLFTSLYPYSHEVSDRYKNNILNAEITTLPETLKNNGYKTAAFTGGLDYSPSFDHMRGFDHVKGFDDTGYPVNFSLLGSNFKKSLNWIKENSKDKFFLFIHGYDTHCPFDPPQEFRGVLSDQKDKDIKIDNKLCLRGYKTSDQRYEATYYMTNKKEKVSLSQKDIDHLKDLYDEEILSVDSLLGNFLEEVDKNILDKTIVVIFSDHGEMFAKHGRFGRAGSIRGTLYDDVLHVPLVIKMPYFQDKKIDGLVQIIDLMPTLLSFLNIDTNVIMQGKNLTPLIKDDILVNEHVFGGGLFIHRDGLYEFDTSAEFIRTNNWKFIHERTFLSSDRLQDTYELYDLINDAGEEYNIATENKYIVEDFKIKMEEWVNQTSGFLQENNKPDEFIEFSDEFIEEAKKMGYW
jgi:choline-sulfatase